MTLDFESSQLTPSERVEEKDRIIKIIEDLDTNLLSQTELDFVTSIEAATVVSPKQLAWLRRIKDKML